MFILCTPVFNAKIRSFISCVESTKMMRFVFHGFYVPAYFVLNRPVEMLRKTNSAVSLLNMLTLYPHSLHLAPWIRKTNRKGTVSCPVFLSSITFSVWVIVYCKEITQVRKNIMGLLGNSWFSEYCCLLSAFRVLFRIASVASGAMMPRPLSPRDRQHTCLAPLSYEILTIQ